MLWLCIYNTDQIQSNKLNCLYFKKLSWVCFLLSQMKSQHHLLKWLRHQLSLYFETEHTQKYRNLSEDEKVRRTQKGLFTQQQRQNTKVVRITTSSVYAHKITKKGASHFIMGNLHGVRLRGVSHGVKQALENTLISNCVPLKTNWFRYKGQGCSTKCFLTPMLTQNRDCYFCIV